MKTATVRDLRYDFPRIESLLHSGEQIEITKRGRTIARLVPAAKAPKRLIKPDILAQLREIWGEKIFTGRQIEQMQSAELDGEEG